MSTGFKYVYNSLHEQSFLSSLSLSCKGCTLVARQQWCLKLRFAAKGLGLGGLEQSLRSGSPWFDEGQEFHSDGCLSGPLRRGHVVRGHPTTSVFLSRDLSSVGVVCVRSWEAGGIPRSPISLFAKKLKNL